MRNTPCAVVFLLLRLASFLSANDEDFAFETYSNENGDQRNFMTDWNSQEQNLVAQVGRVFHLAVPKSQFGNHVVKFEAKQKNGQPLPRWLLFNKEDAIFWGVPLEKNIDNVQLIVRNLGDIRVTKNIIIDIIPTFPLSNNKCSSSEEATLLTLVIDKEIDAIKPKQRVVAVTDISKFFGIPYSAFVLRPSKEVNKNDNLDTTAILAGSGDHKTRSSSATSTTWLEVPVGCDGRIFPKLASLVHQLKRQAKEGTISEVMRLPLISWKVEIRKAVDEERFGRKRRQALDLGEIGSGDYEGDYYDDYEGDYEDDDQTSTKKKTGQISTPQQVPTTMVSSSTTTATTLENTTTHPHRHHHGESKKEEIIPVWPIVDDNSLDNNDNFDHIPLPTSPEVPKVSTTTTTQKTSTAATTRLSTATTPSVATTTTTTSTVTEKPTVTTARATTTVKMEFPVIPNTLDKGDYADYNTEDYEEEDDDENEDGDLGQVESETFVPIPHAPRKTTSKTTTTTTTSTSTTTTTTRTTTSTTTEPTTVKETTIVDVETTTKEVPTTEITKLEEVPLYFTTTNTVPVEVTEKKETNEDVPTTILMTTTTTTTQPPTTSTTTTPFTSITVVAPTTNQQYVEETERARETTASSEILTTPTKLTTLRHAVDVLSYSSSSPPPLTTSVEIENETKNYPPYIENRLRRMNVIAGKIFRFVVPKDTFKDTEDGQELRLEFLDGDENPIGVNSWCQFNKHRREIYGLPLDEHVSKWEYVIRAIDKDGASVQDRLTILVQQHKLQRVFNHEFSLELRIEKREEFKHYVDWSLKTLRALGKIHNTNMSEITVRKIEHDRQPAVFAWSNDSLATGYCPKTEIEKLFKLLTANDRGDPSRDLNNAVAPELKVKKVSYHGFGVCEELNTPIAPPVNYPPILRNPVNHINATVGEMLIFRVPKDTFYDPEDLDTASLRLSLLTSDRRELPPDNWLQFDEKNREFYGLARRPGRNEYQLVCADSGGLTVIDSLEVVVAQSQKRSFNVEFSMTVETPWREFEGSATRQKKFVEKLVEIFGEKNASHFHFLPFKQKQDSTIVTWYNKSLPTEKCDHDEISRLESIMKNEERGISHRVHSIMEPDFQISTIKVLPMSNCKIHKPKYHGALPRPHQPPLLSPSGVDDYNEKAPTDDSSSGRTSTSSTSSSSGDQYLMTFIVPVVVITLMTFCAVLAACVLYRRRGRTGKMSVMEDGRTNYGNKGIPVIFQEELDEKPEAGTKTPAILKDEKPPLAPPEYSRSGSLPKYHQQQQIPLLSHQNGNSAQDEHAHQHQPYHPPPPFAPRSQHESMGGANGRQQRGGNKPAPTYRKPPPYVPP